MFRKAATGSAKEHRAEATDDHVEMLARQPMHLDVT
jgi:hypothetical protein